MIAFHVGTLIFLFVEIVCCKYKLGSTMDVILLLFLCTCEDLSLALCTPHFSSSLEQLSRCITVDRSPSSPTTSLLQLTLWSLDILVLGNSSPTFYHIATPNSWPVSREDGGWCGVYSNTRCILLCSSLISSLITRLTYVLF
ncbi:hypothetical protein EB796_001893 [Bugula neritina]|uniref:Secreted protein n=1 Tax=Bugula neritina TaxID=10212 RepID=A0A7J7KNT7_BUGNE|nr:hypothetical protein EB796_001893 [Bugula neritina]